MKKTRIITSLLLSTLLLSNVTLSGCSSKKKTDSSATSDKVVEIRFAWWGDQIRHDATNKALTLFEQKNPNIKVIREPSGFAGFHDKLTTQIAAGTEPDLFQFANDKYLGDFVSAGRLVSIDEFVGKEINIDNISSSVLSAGQIKGKQYCIPTAINSRVVLFNKKMFDNAKVPYPKNDWTWEDFYNISKKLVAGNPGKYAISDFTLTDDLIIYSIQKGAIFVDKDLKVNAEKQLKQGLELGMKLRTEKLAPPIDISIIENTQQNNTFVTGKSAMKIDATAAADGYAVSLKDKGEVGIVLLPDSSTSNPSGEALIGTNPLAIGRSSENKQAAAKLLDFMINDQDAAKILRTVRGVPTSSKSQEMLKPTLEPINAMVFTAINDITKIAMKPDDYFFAKGAGINFVDIVRQESQKVAYKKTTPAETAKTIKDQMQKSLDKANK
ncbi:MAG: ABC transporter substrate-binding protein [Clostridium sp.]|uniref:ABC transporter substrate-binding protein n=1 Tax=Clostridium sp. TaxID=1506 RepID=UPI003D6CADFC